MSKIPPFNPIEFAEQLDATNDYAVHDGQMLHWCGTHWRTVHEDDIKRKALRWLRQDTVWPVSASNARSAYETALLHFPTLKIPDAECTIIPLMNGYLHIEDAIMRLEPHDKACGQMYVLDCNYDAGAPAPTEFTRFLERVLPDEAVRQRVQEYVGYTLTADARHQRAHLWLGSGANGKGVLANIVQALHARTAAVQLDNLEGFSMSDMVGASLLYCDEAPLRGINEKILKSVIAGEKVSIDIKYRAPISTCLTGKLLVLANHIPEVTDQSQGFWRRWDIVPFDVVIPPAERDSLLAKRIIKHELSGVLNWALEGLKRLVNRGRFDEQSPVAIQRASENAKVETNSVAAWVKEAGIELSTVIDTPKVTAYEHYTAWCKANGMIAVASPKFWKRIPDVLGSAVSYCRHEQEEGYRRYCNIRLSAK